MISRFFLAALALAGLPLAVFAQTPAPAPAPAQMPAPAPAPPVMAQPTNIVPETVRYARCLAEQRPAQADAYLATAPGSPQELQAFDALVPVGDAACAALAPGAAGGATAIPVMFLRGGLAEARYIVRYPDAPPAAVAGAQPVGMTEEAMRARLAAATDQQLELTRVFGDCVVAAWAVGVDQLVRAQAGSSEERAAITALQPTLGSCLPQNQSISFTRESVRAPLADALYRKSEGMVATASTVPPIEQTERDGR